MHQRHQQYHFWHFLKNKEMNETYLSYGISNFALGLVSVFVPIYLYQLGYSMLWILLYYFLLPLNSLFWTRHFVAPLVARIGVKRSILVAAGFKILFFGGLQLLPQHAWLFFILPTFNVLKTQVSSVAYHLNFVEHSDLQKRGRQVSALYSSALLASLLSPLIGGLMIGHFGFNVLFWVAMSLMVASVLPLLFQTNHKKLEPVEFDTKGIYREMFQRKNLPLFTSYGGYAIEEWIGFVVWSMFLYFMLKNTESVGAVNTLVAGITFAVFYFVGKLADKKDKLKLIRLGNILYFFGWVGRIFADTFGSAVVIDSYKNITGNFLQVPWSAYSYDLAAKRNYFRFIIQREIMFDFARAIFVPLVLVVFVIDFQPFFLSFIIAALFSLGYMTIGMNNEQVQNLNKL